MEDMPPNKTLSFMKHLAFKMLNYKIFIIELFSNVAQYNPPIINGDYRRDFDYRGDFDYCDSIAIVGSTIAILLQ